MKSNKKHKKRAAAWKWIVQKQYYNEKQRQYYNEKQYKNGEFAYILFGDNDMDNKTQRGHFGWQARIMGKFDRKFAYGIITTFMKRKTPNVEQLKSIIDALFIPLQNHLRCGYDIVYTYPSKQNLMTHRNRYFYDGKQIIYDNIGTGIAFLSLSIHHIHYIQIKLKN